MSIDLSQFAPGLFRCIECGDVFRDLFPPLAEERNWPACCERDAYLIEPLTDAEESLPT